MWGWLRVLAAATLLTLLVIVQAMVLTASDSSDGGDGESEAEAGEVVEALGSLAAWGGGVLIGAFVVFREGYMRMAKAGLRLPARVYRAAVNAHAATSAALGSAGLLHGYLLRGYATPLEYALAGLAAFTLATGVALRFSRGGTARYARLLHTQRLLALAILVLLLAHLARVGE